MIQITGIRRQIIIAGCMYLGQLLGGFSSGFTGPIIPKLRDPEQSPLPYMLTETEISLIGSLLYIGTLPGPNIIGWISNTKGRKICLIIGGFIGIIAHIVLATTTNLAMLYCGRLLSGCGCGIILVMNIVYIGEMASTHIRGILLTILGIFSTVGSMLAYAVGPFLSYSETCYVGVAVAVIFTCTAFLLPETPLFYALKGDEKNVEKVLKELGRLEDLDNIVEAKQEITSTDSTRDWIELVKLKSNRKALFIVVTINIFQHISGILAVVFFSATIFKMAGSSIDSNLAMIIIGIFQLAGSIVTPFLVERSGRKSILMVSSGICALSMFFFGLYFYLDHIGYSGLNDVKWLPLVILIIFFTSFDMGLGIIPNIIIGEMFTINVRSKGSAITMTSSWLAGFIVTTVFGTMIENFGAHVIFWFFSSTCAGAFLFTMFCIPETKGKSLLEIQELLGKFAVHTVRVTKYDTQTNYGIKRQVLISGCMYIGQMIAGFSTGFTGPVIPKLRDPEQSPLSHMLTETEISLIGSLLYIGALPGPYLMGWISNKRGRKICLIIGGLIGILAYLILATTSNLAMLYSGRFLTGCSCGIILVMNIVYIGEMASTNIRGILLTVLGIFNTLGAILVYAVGPYLSYSATCYVGLGVIIIYTCAACFLPETPLFYALKGDEKNVRKVLDDLGRLDDIDKIADAKKEVITTSTKDWIELVKLKSNRRALFIVVIINILQHLSGILAVVFFSASIFEMAGSSISSNISMIIIGCCQLCGSLFTPLLVERSGRKSLLMVSSGICSLSMFVFGLYFYLEYIDYSGINDIKWLPLVILIIFFTSFDLGFAIIPNTIIGEMFTINVRSTGSAVAMTSSWLAGFGVTTVFGTVVEAFGAHVIFWVFSSTCACACVFTFVFIPETKGKTLLEIQDLLGKRLTYIRKV